MDMSTFKTMQKPRPPSARPRDIGAANLELGKVALPRREVRGGQCPQSGREDPLTRQRHSQSADERKHAAVMLGVGAIAVVGLTVATVAHFRTRFTNRACCVPKKRQVAAALCPREANRRDDRLGGRPSPPLPRSSMTRPATDSFLREGAWLLRDSSMQSPMSPPMTRRPTVRSTWAPPHPCSRASASSSTARAICTCMRI